jgi:hypothetical protein
MEAVEEVLREGGRPRGTAVKEVLTVVEEREGLTLAKWSASAGGVEHLQPEGAGHLPSDQARVANRGQVHEEHAVIELERRRPQGASCWRIGA